MRRCLGVLSIAFMLIGCSSDPLPEPSRAHHVRSECPPPTDNTFYFFPEETDGQRVEYSSQFLAEIDAPSLSCGDTVDEGYRITRLAPGLPSAIIEVLRDRNGWTVRGVEFAHAVYRERGTITKQVRKELTDAEGSSLGTAFAEAGFWRTPPLPPNIKDISYDGPWVTLEARRGSSHHVVFPLASSFGSITSKFFDMAGLDIR